MAPPTGLVRWFASSYLTLSLDPDWLDACVTYLQEHSPPGTTPAQLIKLVEAQLLLSDLSTSTHPPRSLLPSPLPETPSTLYPGRANATLFQILRIDEVGHAALGLLDTLKEKREGRALRERQEREGWERKDGEEERVEGSWPRGMVRVLLSDGHGECEGIEYKRVEGMGLEDVRLGCKLLIKDVKMVRGIMLLSPASVVVKGHAVEELEEHAESLLEASLRARLGLEPLEAAPPQEVPNDVPPPQQQQQDVPPPAQRNPPPAAQRNPTPNPQPRQQPDQKPRLPPAPKPRPPSPKPRPPPQSRDIKPPRPSNAHPFSSKLPAPKPLPSSKLAPSAPKGRPLPPPSAASPTPDLDDFPEDSFEFDEDAERELQMLERGVGSEGNKRRKVEELEGLDGLDFVMMDEPPMEPPEMGKGKGRERMEVEEVVVKVKEERRVPTKVARVVQIEIDDSDDDEVEVKPVVRGKKKVVKKQWGGGEVIVLD